MPTLILRPVATVWTRLLSFVLSLTVLLLAVAPVVATSIQTDLWIYAQGDTVNVSGDGFGASEDVELVTTDPYGVETDRGTVQADPNGNISYSFVLASDVPGIYDVVATGLSSGLTASTQFDPANYAVTAAAPAAAQYSDTASFSGTFTCTRSGGPSGGPLCPTTTATLAGSLIEVMLFIDPDGAGGLAPDYYTATSTTVAAADCTILSTDNSNVLKGTCNWAATWQAGRITVGSTTYSVPPALYGLRVRATGGPTSNPPGSNSTKDDTKSLTVGQEASSTSYTGATSGTEGTSLALSAQIADLDDGVGAGNGVFSPDSNLAGTNVVTFQLRNAADTLNVGAPVSASIDQWGDTTGGPTMTLPAAGTYKMRTSYAGNSFYAASGPDIDTITSNPADSTPPDAPSITSSSPSSPANDNNPKLIGSAEAGSTVNIYTNTTCTGVPAASGTAAAFASPGLTVSVFDDTTTSFYATATDAANNTSLCSTPAFVYVEDSSAPAVSAPDLDSASDTGSSSSDNLTKDTSPTFNGTAESFAAVELLRDGSVVASGSADAAGNWSLTDPSASPDDTYTYTARATDAAGNSATSSGLDVTIDSAAPAVSAPDLDSASDTGSSSSDNLTKDTSPTFNGTAESFAAVELLRDGSVVASGSADAAGNWSLTDPSASPDDTYTYTARATDAAGNSATSSGLDVTIDSAAPAVSAPDLDSASDTGSSSSDNLTKDTSPTFNGTAESFAAVELLRDGSVVASGSADAAGNWSLTDPSASPDDTYTYTARATDAAGNSATSSGLDVTIDSAAPAVSAPDLDSASDTGSSSSDNLTKDTSPTFNGTAESFAAVELLRDGSVVASGSADAAGNWSLTDPSASPDDTYTYTARATDAAGNSATSSGLDVTIDSAAPAVSAPDLDSASDTGSSSSDNLTKDTSPTFNGTAESFAAVELLRDGSVVASGSADAAGNWSLTDPSASPDDTYTYTARATDAAGNSATSSGLDVTIDSAAPAVSAPDLDSASDTGSSSSDNLTKDTSPTFNGTAESFAAVELLRDGSVVASGSADAAGNWSLTDPSASPDDTYTYTARATDAAGNSATSSGLDVTIDSAAPAVSAPDLDSASDTGSSSSDNLTKDTSPTFNGTAESFAAVELLRDGSVVASGSADAAGNWSLTDPSASPDDTYTYTARATDAAGNSATSSGLDVTIDSAAPNTTINSTPPNPSNDSTPTFTFSADEAATFQCKVDGGAYAACSSPHTTAALTDGSHTFYVYATDTAGNDDLTPDSYTWVIDTVAPNTTINSTPPNPSNDSTPTFTFSADEAATFQCKVDGGAYAACSSPHTTAALTDGSHTFYVYATDTAGNDDLTPDSYTWVIDTAAPTVVITFPVPASFTAVSWNAGCGTVFVGDFCGTTADVGGSGVATVRYSVRQGSGNYWDGNGFDSSTEVFLPPSGLASWTQAFVYSNFPAAGTYTIRAKATDVAGNDGFAIVTFTVNNPGGPYTFEGFFSPVDNPPVVNQSNAGSAVPVKWRITQTSTGMPVSDPNSFVALTSREVPCNELSALGVDVLEAYTTGTSGLQYLGDGRWQFNWKTVKSWAGSCRVMTLTLNDGSTHDAYFKFK